MWELHRAGSVHDPECPAGRPDRRGGSATDVDLDALTAALRDAEADAEAKGWGDEGTFLFRVVGDPADPYLELILRTEQYPVAAVDGWIADGLGLGGESRAIGVVAVSEAWRHLDDDELRHALPEVFVETIAVDDDPRTAWAGPCR